MSDSTDHLAVLFDGDCNLCNRLVNFLIDIDRNDGLRFASQQSDIGIELIAKAGLSEIVDNDTVVVIDGQQSFLRSDAAVRIAKELPWPWKLGVALRFVPRPLRNAAYDLVARNRTRLVRTPPACRIPTPDRTRRFL